MDIYKISDEKFKSIFISYNITCEVKDTDIFSNYSVLGALMAKSSNKFKTQKQIEKYLSRLYGATYHVNVEKIGDLYNIEFVTEFINKKFLPNKEELLYSILDFIEEVIYNPADWNEENIEREKEFILERISERKDEKLRYGIQRAEELMCQGEPFGTYLYGESEVVEKINKEIMKKSYKELIKNCVTVLIVGNLNGYEDIDIKIRDRFSKYTSEISVSSLKENISVDKEFKYEEVKECQDTTQSVISLGLRVNEAKPEDFYVLNVYNAILGTTPSSKLFQNVREKESLCYTIRSRYYRLKNIIVIYAGINKENYQKALDTIIIQLEDMKKGNISDIEFETAKDSLIADLCEMNDSKVGMAKMVLSNLIAFKDTNKTIEEIKENIMKIKKEDVVNIANNIELEKVFLLGGESNA